MPEIPEDPLTSLATGAVQQHEVFMAWVESGFTRAEALDLLKTMLAAIITINPPRQAP